MRKELGYLLNNTCEIDAYKRTKDGILEYRFMKHENPSPIWNEILKL